MSEFHLIDIISQRDEVEAHLRGRTLEEKERWFASQGELVRLPEWPGSPQRYAFKSRSGIDSRFAIREDELLVFGDHFVYPRKKA